MKKRLLFWLDMVIFKLKQLRSKPRETWAPLEKVQYWLLWEEVSYIMCFVERMDIIDKLYDESLQNFFNKLFKGSKNKAKREYQKLMEEDFVNEKLLNREFLLNCENYYDYMDDVLQYILFNVGDFSKLLEESFEKLKKKSQQK